MSGEKNHNKFSGIHACNPLNKSDNDNAVCYKKIFEIGQQPAIPFWWMQIVWRNKSEQRQSRFHAVDPKHFIKPKHFQSKHISSVHMFKNMKCLET